MDPDWCDVSGWRDITLPVQWHRRFQQSPFLMAVHAVLFPRGPRRRVVVWVTHAGCLVGEKAEARSLPVALRSCSDKSVSSDYYICRICHEESGWPRGPLLSPCRCSGSLAWVHAACLETWLETAGASSCELCRHEFSLERSPRPFVEWLRSPAERRERRTLLGDTLCFLFISPLAAISAWLCLRGASDHLGLRGRLEAGGLIVLTAALLLIYLFWSFVSDGRVCES
uniref:Membrane associated ring-CH-type finger 3 n=1 Tax=Eptatretus burgeri TaxID=7764 RepID=A0A8C4WSG2_EPTBU